MIVVTTAADNTALTTLETVKSDLGITDTSEDDFLNRMIRRATETVVNYLRIPTASDGSRTIGRQTVTEIFYEKGRRDSLILSLRVGTAWPVSIVSVSEDDDALVAADYRLENGYNLLRLSDETNTADRRPVSWSHGAIVSVSYTAGWRLPDDSDRDLPQSIEEAAISLVKNARAAKTRDSSLKSESVLSGLYSYTLFQPSDSPDGLPPDVVQLLRPYVNNLVI